MLKPLLTMSAVVLLANSTSSFAAADCGKVTIADMNWNSATLIAHVDQFILEHGYGCDAELVPGDTMPTSTSMIEKGEPDIASELWINQMQAALEKGVEEKRLRLAGQSLSEGGEEGFWVPEYMVKEYPELATIKGVRKHADLFKHPENPDMSAFYGCPAGWACQISAANLFHAMKMEDDNFELIDPGSGAGLAASIAKAYERQAPWFGYYWAPTAILGKYKMVKVDFGTGVDLDEYRNCTVQEDCVNPKVTMYPSAPVYTVTSESFAKKAPEAYEYLSARSFTNAQLNELLAWMEQNQADGEIVLEHFLSKYENIWGDWLPEEVSRKVKVALKEM